MLFAAMPSLPGAGPCREVTSDFADLANEVRAFLDSCLISADTCVRASRSRTARHRTSWCFKPFWGLA
jgi:hypothetical protein